MTRNFLILINPGKKLKSVQDKVSALLKKHDLLHETCNDLTNKSLKHFTDLIVIGGDGTLNYAINQLTSFEVPLGIIPAGSGNDYVKSFNIGNTLDEQIHTAIGDRVMGVDLGQCNDLLFANGFGIGFDGQIAKSFEENRTILNGQSAYYYHVVRTLAGFRPRELAFSVDGKKIKDIVLLLTIGKGTTFGGGFRLTPHANLSDGEFAISFIRNLKPLRRFLNIHRLKDGSHGKLKEVEFLKGKSISIEAQPELIAHIDGELVGSPPFNINVLPNKLKIKVRSVNS